MTQDAYPATPELDKMTAVSDESQTAGEFLAWLIDSKGYVLCKYVDGFKFPQVVYTPITELLAEFYGIDIVAAEAERTQVLEWVRAQ